MKEIALKVYDVKGFLILTPTQLSYKDCHLSNKTPITERDLKSRCPNMTFSPHVSLQDLNTKTPQTDLLTGQHMRSTEGHFSAESVQDNPS